MHRLKLKMVIERWFRSVDFPCSCSMYVLYLWLFYLTIAHKISRVWCPGTHCWYSIWWHTSSTHSPNWNKAWVAPEDYLCCVNVLNHTILRDRGRPTVDWREKVDCMQLSWRQPINLSVGMRLICGHSFQNNWQLCRASIIGNNRKANAERARCSQCAHRYKTVRGLPFYS